MENHIAAPEHTSSVSVQDISRMPSLTIIEPDKEPRTLELKPESLIIGRSQSKCQLTFDFLGLSGRHCEIVPAGETFKLRDLESANHTFVNNREIVEHYLNHGDRIALGVIILTFNNEAQKQPPKRTSGKTSGSTPTPAPPAAPPGTYAEPTFIMDGDKLRKKMEQLRSGKISGVDSDETVVQPPTGGGTAKDYARAAQAAHDAVKGPKNSDHRWLFFVLGFVLAFGIAFGLGFALHVMKVW